MKCVVIDDEPLAREGMAMLIAEVPELELVSSFSNPMEADAYLKSHPVDILFIDMQMPTITGMEYLRSTKPDCHVIITTAFSEFALEGFDVGAVDYLVKPIRFERFYKAVSKVLTNEPSLPVRSESPEDPYLFIRTERKFVRIKTNDILYLEGLKDYVMIHTALEKYAVATNLKSVLSQLPPEQFLRVNKSYIVNTCNIQSIDANFITLGNAQVPIGDTYRPDVQEFLKTKRVIRREL